MNTDTHTHIATQVKQYSHKQRGEPESRRQSSPRGAPSSYLHPSSSFSLLGWGWGGGYTGVTCLLLKVSKHPGESLFTPLKKVGIPISRRPSSPSATHGCRGDEKRNQEAATAINRNFFFFWPAQLLVPPSFQYFYALISRLSSLLLLPLFFSSRSLRPYLHAKPPRFDTLHLACQRR